MKLKTAIAAALVAAASSAATADQTVNLGLLTSLPKTFSSFVLGSFTDTYTFSLGPLSTGVTGLYGSLEIAPAFSISGLQITLTGTPGGPQTDTTPSDGFSFAGLGTGNYALKLVGTATGMGGGIYGGSVAAVPEPETYALFFAGLGVVGFVARRRRPQ
jgi:PEP-CTERM motif